MARYRAYPYMPGSAIDEIIADKKIEEKAKKQLSKDSQERIKIQARINELKEKVFPKEEALIRIQKEYADCKWKEFFGSWVSNVYNKKNKNMMDNRDKHKGEER